MTSESNEIWQVDVNGTIYEAAFGELSDWIDGGSLLPDDKVRRGNLRWIEAKRVPSLLPFFNAKEKGVPMPVVVTTTTAPAIAPAKETQPTDVQATPEPIIQPEIKSTIAAAKSDPAFCLNHTDFESQFICDGCGVGLCRTCVKSYGGSVRICSICGSMCKPVNEVHTGKKEEARRIAAAAEGFGFGDFANALAHPFRFKTSLFFGAGLFMLFSLGQSASSIGGIFMMVAALFCLMLANMLTFGILSNTVENFVKGKLDENFMPDFEDFSLWDDVIHPFFLSIGVYLTSFGPLLAVFLVGMYMVMTSVSSQMNVVNSELEKIPGTQVYSGRQLVDQSGDVKKILNGIAQKQANRVESLTNTAETNNVNIPANTALPVADQESREQEEIWAAAVKTQKQSLESTFGKTPETRAQENQQMFAAFLQLAAPLVVVGFIALLWGLFYFPAACAVAGYTKSFFATINPLVGLDTIRRLGFNYIKILFMGFLLFVLAIFVGFILAIILSPFDLPGMGNLIAKALSSMVTFYICIVFSCIIGYALFKSADKLKLLR
ncbi:MAG TPA: DUF4013 domain-containing protein [Pyrinomonadaceae bacterium]|nr:DUF4013 domain-containing protein [Pyrinomonadaceae bacterium]